MKSLQSSHAFSLSEVLYYKSSVALFSLIAMDIGKRWWDEIGIPYLIWQKAEIEENNNKITLLITCHSSLEGKKIGPWAVGNKNLRRKRGNIAFFFSSIEKTQPVLWGALIWENDSTTKKRVSRNYLTYHKNPQKKVIQTMGWYKSNITKSTSREKLCLSHTSCRIYNSKSLFTSPKLSHDDFFSTALLTIRAFQLKLLSTTSFSRPIQISTLHISFSTTRTSDFYQPILPAFGTS